MVMFIVCSPFNFAPTCILVRRTKEYSNASGHRVLHVSAAKFILLLLILIQTNGRINFKSMIKEFNLSKFCTVLYSILNQREKLFREKMSTKCN